MTLDAKVIVRDGVVVLELRGEYRRAEHTARNEEYMRMVDREWIDRSQPLRLLIDLRGVSGELTRKSGYHNVVREWGEDRNKRIAWLYDDPANDPQYRYRETVARNHGFIARAFRDEDEAMKWLTETGGGRRPDGY